MRPKLAPRMASKECQKLWSSGPVPCYATLRTSNQQDGNCLEHLALVMVNRNGRLLLGHHCQQDTWAKTACSTSSPRARGRPHSADCASVSGANRQFQDVGQQKR